MRRSAHGRYREHLRALEDEAMVDEAIAAVNEREGWLAAAPGWRRCAGRFYPDRAPFAVLAYERRRPGQVQVCRVEAYAGIAAAEWPASARVALGPDCCIHVSPIWKDPVLTTLPGVFEARPGASVVRYRPDRRCTLRTQTDGRVRYGKVFPDQRGKQLCRESEDLWNAAGRGELGFSVARPITWNRDLRVFWQEAIAGRPLVEQLLGATGPIVATRMGRALASLHSSTLRPTTHYDADAQLARSRRYADQLCRHIPPVRASLGALLKRLDALQRAWSPRRLRPLHGAPHAQQWLDTGPGLGLVDFDRFAWGEPELDVATFLAEMDFERTAAVSLAAVRAAFVSGYEAHGRPVDSDRLRVYRAHKRLAKAHRSARGVRCDGDERALRHVRFAAAALDEAGV